MRRLIFISLAALAACTHNDRADTIRASLIAVDAARDGLLVYDREHQPSLVAGAVSGDDARAKLLAYRATRDCATCPAGLIDSAFHAIAAAAAANDAKSLADMQAVIAQAVAAVKPLIGGAK